MPLARLDWGMPTTRENMATSMPSNAGGDRYCDQHYGGSRLRRLGVRCRDLRHATSSAFKDIKVEQVARARFYTSEPHSLTAAWAKRRLWCVIIRVFVAHRAWADQNIG
jgi:hypothetical protein